MKESIKDRIAGNLHEAKGTVTEKLGQATDNPKLTAKGTGEKLAGKVQKKLGQIKRVFEK